MIQMNYEQLLIKTEGILNSWKNRNLGLHSKVMVINSLVGSLFVYKMSVLPKIPVKFVKRFEKICNMFLWNGRQPKIPIHKLQNHKNAGGLSLVNLDIKDNALKAAWVPYLVQDDFVAHNAYHALNTQLGHDIWRCNLQNKDLRLLYSNMSSFWIHVLGAWTLMNFEPNINEENFDLQTVWLNSHIRFNNKPFFWKKPYSKGLLYVGQILKNNISDL